MKGPIKDIRGYLYYTDDANTFGISDGFKYEEYDRGLIIDHIKPGDIFVDIGAGHGFYSIPAAAKGARVYAIECNVESVNLIDKSTYDNDVLLNLCPWFLSDKISYKDFIHTYGELADKNLLPSCDINFLKIDIEGCEFKAMRSMKDAIDSSPSIRAVIEFFPEKLRDYGEEPHKFISFLKSLGFTIDYLNHHEYFHSGTNPVIKSVTYENLVSIYQRQNISVGNLYCYKE